MKSSSQMLGIVLVVTTCMASSHGAVQSEAGDVAQLTQDGQSLLPIVVSKDASKVIQQAAHDLAHVLETMSGGRFEIVLQQPVSSPSDLERGIFIGLATHFAIPSTPDDWAHPSTLQREDYLLKTSNQGVWLIGTTDLAVQHAVWDFLYQLGYRQYFPGAHWEVIPRQPTLAAKLDVITSPSYRNRRIWYGFGAWDYAKQPYADWCKRNRMGGSIQLSTGHAYDGLVKALRDEFEQHPEYWPLLDGERKKVRNPKPCLGNPAVRALIVAHAVKQFERDAEIDSVSMDPSDGGGWCQCDACAQLGSVSDQALTLANEVAAAINARFPDKYVGMYAYSFHSPPPRIRVDPHVIVSVATAFIKGGYTLDDLISGWAGQGATLGIREYYSVNTWDRDQPAHARGGNLAYLQRSIPEFHALGARYLSAESSDNWGPNGLGYYLAARMMWDVGEAQRTASLIDDFLLRAFGPAAATMREFYDQLDGSRSHLVENDQLGRMYQALQQAGREADKSAIQARVDDLTLYARYCTLYHRYASASGPARQEAFEALIRHAYRMRTTMMVHTLALYRDLASRDKTVSIPENATWNVPEDKNPWKSSQPFTREELAAFLNEGIESHTLVELDFKPVQYSSDLVPAADLFRPASQPVAKLGPGRGTQVFYTYFTHAPAILELEITGGLISHYRDRGNVRVELWQIGGASQTGEQELLVASDRSVPPDGQPHTIRLTAPEPGLYRVTVNDGNDRTLVNWPLHQPMTVISSQQAPINDTYGQWEQYFYVPRGTQTLGFYGGQHGEIRDSQDRPHFWLNGRENNFYSVAIPAGEDGRVWKVRYVRGPLILLTVPPCFAASPQTMLLPREVVEQAANQDLEKDE